MQQLLDAPKSAELLGVSLRQFNTLRQSGWFPLAIQLGPRSLRWDKDELLTAVKENASRIQMGSEPAHLAGSRIHRCR
jgi:predicted DNA-binding transcriptional regulator AlpA